MGQPPSRRKFLEVAGGALATTAAFPTVVAAHAQAAEASPPDTGASAEATPPRRRAADGDATGDSPQEAISVVREIFSGHAELVLQRSRQEQARLADSLRRADARPLTLAAYQMVNRCGGEAGKRANLDHILLTKSEHAP